MNTSESHKDLRLTEFLILALLWMVFGFMLWYYLSVFHGAPVRILSSEILSHWLGSDFLGIVTNSEQRYLFEVQTKVPFLFPDGSREALGFIVNPLIYGFGLPLMFGLVMASGTSFLKKVGILFIGYLCVMLTQVWGVVWQTLKMLAFDFGSDAHQVTQNAGIPDELIALCYQLGVLIFPPLVPVVLWVLANWTLIEHFSGWQRSKES
jgi:uncharacterized membrane protein